MYSTWSGLREILHDLVGNMGKSGDFDGSEAHRDFKLLLLISHYLATRSAFQTQSSLKETCAKISVALLRHSDVLPADKAFYEAGMAARGVGWDNMAFVFLNRYLDLYEAIEESSLDMLDNTDFMQTDIPFEVGITAFLFVPVKNTNISGSSTRSAPSGHRRARERQGVGVGRLHGPKSGTGVATRREDDVRGVAGRRKDRDSLACVHHKRIPSTWKQGPYFKFEFLACFTLHSLALTCFFVHANGKKVATCSR
jgi:hypothetical protein